jgi:hypothetical protein
MSHNRLGVVLRRSNLRYAVLTILLVAVLLGCAFAEDSVAVPRLVKISGTISGSPSGTVGVIFALYKDQSGGAPLWQEVQSVTVDSGGHYTLLLGASTPAGIPVDLFSTGEARWLAVQPEGQPEQPRVLLLSVPYAFKASDSETLGGLPASAFLRAAATAAPTTYIGTAAVNSAAKAVAASITVSSPAIGYLPYFYDASGDLKNSKLFETSNGNVGVATTTPATTLDVGGAATVRGTLNLPPTSAATHAAGVNSPLLEVGASSYSSTKSAAVTNSYGWQASALGNNSTAPYATLNLMYIAGTAAPKWTGFSVDSTGQVIFGAGQTFPYTVNKVIAGTGLTGGGSASATSGSLTLNLDTTKVPLLATANTFTGNQTFTGHASVSGTLTAANAVLGTANITGGLSTSDIIATGEVAAQNTLRVQPSLQATSTSTNGSYSFLEASASAYNSSTRTAVQQNFYWGAFPDNNNTANPSAELDLMFGTGNGSFSGTGLAINSKGILSFASGQTFPIPSSGPGSGTITAVVPGTALTGGGNSGEVTLGVDSTQVPLLAASNNFTGLQTIAGSAYSGGALAVSNNGYGTAVNIYSDTQSNVSQNQIANYDAALWADSGSMNGMIGSSDEYNGGSFFNNSAGYATVLAKNFNSGGSTGLAAGVGAKGFGTVIRAEGQGGVCGINSTGDVSCTGELKALATTQGGSHQVETYAVQSAESWLEDFGSGKLDNGKAIIQLDPTFADAANTGVEYHVFLTPKGDAQSLYVTNETASGFEVRESAQGAHSIAFDYRIVAKRKGHETERLTDVTDRFATEKMAADNRPLPRLGKRPGRSRR